MSIAIYPGSFDPVTLGHLSVIRQAARLYPHVVVLVAINPEKRGLFSLEERVSLVRDAVKRFPNVSVDATEGLVVDYAREIGATVLVRGLRGASDADVETTLANHNRQLAPEIATVLLPAAPELAQVSSSRLKELARTGADLSPWCPPLVAEQLRSRIAPEGVSR
ncbi:MAG: pantetheine-phosphate adenylyltransferase [Myxococcaceae bacterium]